MHFASQSEIWQLKNGTAFVTAKYAKYAKGAHPFCSVLAYFAVLIRCGLRLNQNFPQKVAQAQLGKRFGGLLQGEN